MAQSYSRIDPAQEITRIRHSVSVLESYIFPAPRPPTQRRQSDASNLVPKKELIDPDVTDKHHAPGILGNQGHGLSQGLYAGPTSTLHLLVPFCIAPLPPEFLQYFLLSIKIADAPQKKKNQILFKTQIVQEISRA